MLKWTSLSFGRNIIKSSLIEQKNISYHLTMHVKLFARKKDLFIWTSTLLNINISEQLTIYNESSLISTSQHLRIYTRVKEAYLGLQLERERDVGRGSNTVFNTEVYKWLFLFVCFSSWIWGTWFVWLIVCLFVCFDFIREIVLICFLRVSLHNFQE